MTKLLTSLCIFTLLFIQTIFFTTAQPSISSFTPASGFIGSSVTITGNNFDPTPINNIVFFGATQATVISSSSNELIVTVPPGATFMPISVLVNGLLTYSSKPFVATFDGTEEIDKNSFATKVDLNTGEESFPFFIYATDLDGDGNVDLAITIGSGLSILRNTSTTPGLISYANNMELVMEYNPNSIAAGDFDGDGKIDMAMTNSVDNTLSIIRNTSSIGSISFETALSYSTEETPYSISTGDVDLDGKVDLVVANRGSSPSSVSIFRNLSTLENIVFAPKLDYETGFNPESVVIGDIDSDNKVDIATANRGSNSISILRNMSTGPGSISFATKVDYATGSTPIFIALGDLDNNGKTDLTVINRDSNSLSIFKNYSSIGNITFNPKVDYETGNFPFSVAINDLNGDGKVDLSVTNWSSSTISVYKNTNGVPGDLSFADKIDYPTSALSKSIIISDLNNDNKPEMIIVNPYDSNISIFRHPDSNEILKFNFQEQVGESLIDAVNHTANIEVAYGTNITNLISTFNLSTGATAQIATTPQVSGITENDFSNPVTYIITAEDGITVQNWTVSVTETPPNTETDILSFSLSEQVKAVTPDITTHKIDITAIAGTDISSLISSFTLSSGATIHVGATNQVSGVTENNFSTPLTYTITAEDGINIQNWIVSVIAVPTITSFFPENGSTGTPVIITGSNFDSTPSNNVVFFGATQAIVNSSTSSELTVTVPKGASYKPITVLVNELLAHSSKPFIVTFDGAEGIDENSFVNAENFQTIAPWSAALSDLDGDGKTDFITANRFNNSISIFRNTSEAIGSISHSDKKDYETGIAPRSVTINDIDGDGKPDVIVANFGSGSSTSSTVSIFRNISTIGNINFDTKIDYPAESFTNSVAIGDIDSDGKPELIIASAGNSSISIFKNTSSIGSITYDPKVNFVTGAAPNQVVTGDLDGDGKMDLAVTNLFDNSISLFKNTSMIGIIDDSSLASKVDYMVGTRPNPIAISDIDGDAKPDLIVASGNGEDEGGVITVFKNNSTIGTIDGSSFAPKVDFPTVSTPYSISIGDLDGDGKVDLAAANASSDILSIFKNTSIIGSINTSSFANKVEYVMGKEPSSVTIGDLDQDNQPDMIVTNYSDNTISIFRHTSSDDILAFSFSEQTNEAIIDATNHTIDIEIRYGSNLNSLTSAFALSSGAIAQINTTNQISEVTENNFTHPVIYSVIAADGITIQDWLITVNVAANTATDILDFSFSKQTAAATINTSSHSINIEVLNNTNITNLIASFTLSYGATLQINLVDQVSTTTTNDFTNPINYTVIAENKTTKQDWIVTTTIASNQKPSILPASFDINENSPVGTILGQLLGSDPNADVLSYSIVSGNELSAFFLNQDSGELSVANNTPLDYETTTAFNLEIQVSDGKLTNSTIITIKTIDVNESPIFSTTTFTLDENVTTVSAIGQVICFDPDGDDLKYSIISGNESGTFFLNENSGELSVSNPSLLDFETTKVFNLEVQAKDEELASSTIIIVNIKDVNESPEISNTSFSLNENSAIDILVGQLSASDPDGDDLEYSIISGNESGTFSLNENSGELSVTNPTLLDFETTKVFNLEVQAKDEELASSTIIIVNIKDVNESPEIFNTSFSLNENSAIDILVGQLSASDPDGDDLKYSIISGNESGTFSLNENSGELSITNPTLLDFETTKVFNLEVQAKDEKLASSTIIIINIKDVNESPEISNTSFSLNENSAIDILVGQLSASDPDGDDLKYSIISGNESGTFSLNENSGELSVSNPSLLDFETTKIFNLKVQAKDEELASLAMATITLNNINESPILYDTSFNLAENSPKGTIIGQITGSDPDENNLSYLIISGNESAPFLLDRTSGELSVADATLLDFESATTFIIDVLVEDGELTSTAIITIHLTDVDEISTITAIQNNTIGAVNLYPNPTKNILTVDWNNFKTLVIYDLSGQIVMISNQKKLNLEGFNSGMYLLKLQGNNGTVITKRIIKQ